jgi:T5SS/PEP-CTERM-associated repeat protein
MAAGAFIGDTGNGAARISEGEFIIGNDSIHVGWRPGGIGTLTIDGPDALVTSADDFQLGREGTGSLQFSAGQLRAGYTVVGKFGEGIWNQTGGLFDQDFGDLEVGDGGTNDQAGTAGPRAGTVVLSGGFIQTAGHLAIGNRRGTGMVTINEGVLAATGGSSSNIFIGRGADSSQGVGGPTELRVRGSDSIIVANGSLLMNTDDVATSSTLTAAITGPSHSTIKVSGDADVRNGILKIELEGYQPSANDEWILVRAGAELDDDLEVIDGLVDAAGYDPLGHDVGAFLGNVMGPFLSVDTSMAPLAGNLDWDVDYTQDEIILSVVGSGNLVGDYNGDSALDALDIDLQAAEMKRPPAEQDLAKFDHNDDGVIDVGTPGPDDTTWGDRLIWIKNLRQTSVGDSNLDNLFDSGDLVLVFGAGKYETGEMATWAQGDWNGDMVFGSGDLVFAFSDGGYVAAAGPAAVPEPSSLVLVTLSGLSLVGVVRRRGRTSALAQSTTGF